MVNLDELLLDAKLRVPHTAAGQVSRSAIIDAARASSCRVIGVTAPAGYGKSTLLAQWARIEDRQVAWVSLDRMDDDPTVLLTLLANAFARDSQAHRRVVGEMRGIGVSALGRSAPYLAAVLNASPRPFVLMLDDLHELRSAACNDVLGVVLSAIPAGSQLVAASRHAQPHLPRLRAGRDALELTSEDLALDYSGAQQIFAECHVDLTHEEAVHLTERTEGWPAGLYLAALMARDSREPVGKVSGDDRYISDYLYRETLSQQDEGVQQFLRRSAVLDLASGPLCDAVLDRRDSATRLRALEASSLFVHAVDRRRQWFRYHALFREFLVGELRRVEPEVEAQLHTRAAAFYDEDGSPGMAVEHLLQTDNRRRSAELVARIALPTYQSGQVATVQRWLTTLGDEPIKDYPPLAVLQCWLAALTGKASEAQRWSAFLDGISFDDKPADGSASFESARAMLRAGMCAAGPERAMTDARLAVEQEEPWSAWRDLALYLSGEAQLLAGNRDRASALFEESADVAEKQDNAEVLVLSESELALLDMDRGRWDAAARHVDSGLGAVEAHGLQDYVASFLASSVAARLELHRGVPGRADRLHGRAMRGRATCTHALPFLAVRGRLQLAKVSWATADGGTTRHLLREIDDIIRLRPSLGVLVDEVDELRAKVSVANDHQLIDGAAPLTPAELRLLPYLQTHLTVAEIGARLFISRNTASSEISSIYRKLGVSSRNAAVQEATAMGLLGE